MTEEELFGNVLSKARKVNETVDMTNGKPMVAKRAKDRPNGIAEDIDTAPNANGTYTNINTNYDDDYIEKDKLWEERIQTRQQQILNQNSQTMEYNPQQQTKKNSKLPSFIQESMTNNVIDTQALDPRYIENKLHGVDYEKYYPKQQVTEQITPTSQSFDYSIIKAIINECLDNKLKNIVAENTLKTIGLKEGKIKIVDNKGNIYSAELKKTGNVNNQ